MKYVFSVAAIIILCNCRPQKTVVTVAPADTLVRIISWGLPDFYTAAAQHQLATQWGFYFDNVGSCTASEREIDSFKTLNEIAERPLVARYGKDWNQRYLKEFAAITANPQQACLLFHFNDSVAHTRQVLALSGDTLFYHFSTTKHRGIYTVNIIGWDRQGNQKAWVSFYQYRVDCIANKATLTRKKKRTDTAYLSGYGYFSEDSFTFEERAP